MEKTTEEKARAKLLKLGRKNKWNRAVAVPLLFFVMSFFHIRNYCHNNGKRFAVMLGTFFLFAVYSSFSFPAFITEDTGTDYELKNTDTQNISLAEEKEPDMAGLELLEDEDVLEQSDYNSTSHGYALVDKYDASDILQASEAIVSENADAEKTGEDGSVTEDDNAEQEEFRSDDWRLVLINKQNSIPDDYAFQLGTIKGKMQCDKRILEDLLAMLEAAGMVKDGMTVMIGGFLGNGSPHAIIDALVESGVKDLTLIVNDTAYPDKGCGRLIAGKQVRKVIVSHIGTNPCTSEQMNSGELEIEFCPQGTLAERVRSGGAGLGGVLTPVGLGTIVAEGKQIINVDGKDYLLEKPLRADVALLGASLADRSGNLVYKGTSQNFNPLMATAADLVIAEVRELVETGAIAPEAVRTPGIFVDYMVAPAK